jgi:hypothetical protein
MKKDLTDSEFNTIAHNVQKFFKDNATKYGFNLTWFNATFTPKMTQWDTAFEIASDPARKTHGAVVDKDVARADLKPEFSQMVRMIQDAPDVTDGQLAGLEIPRRKPASNRPLPAPPFPPDIQLRTPAPGVVEVHASNALTGKHAKPPGARVCIAAYVIRPASEPAPTTQEELTQSVIISAGKVAIRSSHSKRAHILYVSGHWVNAVGDTSPWSGIMSVAIP